MCLIFLCTYRTYSIFISLQSETNVFIFRNMKDLVTGAKGLLGHHLVQQLIALQAEVHVIVRSTKGIFFPLDKVQLFTGNFTDPSELSRAADGCHAIIHAAAVTDTHFLSYKDYEAVNVKACETLLEVADSKGI